MIFINADLKTIAQIKELNKLSLDISVIICVEMTIVKEQVSIILLYNGH